MDKPKKKLKLYKALKIGYLRNEKRQAKVLKKFGYVLDKDLTNRERMVAFNPYTKKVLFVENGTDPRNPYDIANDISLAAGRIKKTGRFKRAKNTLNIAHDRYKDYKFTLAAHSLGGNIANYIAPKTDKVINYNAAYSPFVRPRENVKNFRVASDPISAFSPQGNTTELKIPKQEKEIKPQQNKLLRPSPKEKEPKQETKVQGNAIQSNEPATEYTAEIVGSALNPLRGHNLENIRNTNIFL